MVLEPSWSHFSDSLGQLPIIISSNIKKKKNNFVTRNLWSGQFVVTEMRWAMLQPGKYGTRFAAAVLWEAENAHDTYE